MKAAVAERRLTGDGLFATEICRGEVLIKQLGAKTGLFALSARLPWPSLRNRNTSSKRQPGLGADRQTRCQPGIC